MCFSVMPIQGVLPRLFDTWVPHPLRPLQRRKSSILLGRKGWGDISLVQARRAEALRAPVPRRPAQKKRHPALKGWVSGSAYATSKSRSAVQARNY